MLPSQSLPLLLLVSTAVLNNDVAAFTVPQLHLNQPTGCLLSPSSSSSSASALYAKKQKKKSNNKSKSSGGGFGSKAATTATTKPVSADKDALETQWDTFASITDLEIAPLGNPDDEDYQHFLVTDVFVRVGPDDADGKPGTGWYRTGKAVAADYTDINAALTLQKGLILWTAVHMWPPLAAKGKAGAQQLQLGYMPPSMNMADETDGALDEEESEDVLVSERVPVQGVSIKNVGFRPDFNPPGFTYKRREKAAMKKKKSALDEIVEAS